MSGTAGRRADRQRPPRSRSARAVFGLGLGLVVAGLALLGWAGWQVYGTNYVSKNHQAAAVAKLEKSWRTGAVDGPVEVAGGTATAIVRIPRFGKGYAVPLLEGTDDAALASGFGHFDNSAKPGDKGNFAVAAHRITHGEPLRGMPSLRPGDQVIVQTQQWTYTYELITGGADLVVPFTAGWVLDPVPANPAGGPQPAQRPGQRLITLTTCSELFHTDDRMIAFGVLVAKDRT